MPSLPARPNSLGMAKCLKCPWGSSWSRRCCHQLSDAVDQRGKKCVHSQIIVRVPGHPAPPTLLCGELRKICFS